MDPNVRPMDHSVLPTSSGLLLLCLFPFLLTFSLDSLDSLCDDIGYVTVFHGYWLFFLTQEGTTLNVQISPVLCTPWVSPVQNRYPYTGYIWVPGAEFRDPIKSDISHLPRAALPLSSDRRAT